MTRRSAIVSTLLFLACPVLGEHKWAEFGQSVCDERGEGIHVLRYDNGEVKASVVCGEYADKEYVKQARYSDRNGRGLAQEETVPTDPSKSFFREWIYDSVMGAPVEERLYNAKGVLLRKGPPAVEKASSDRPQNWETGTFNEYQALCEDQPSRLLHPVLGKLEGRQFFEKNACQCIAEKTVRLDEERPAEIMWSKQLDPSNRVDRVAFATGRHLNDCVCPEAVPGSQLEEICRKNPTLGADWAKKRD